MLEGGHGPYAADEVLAYRNRRGEIEGVVYYGSQLVLAADHDAALDAFAVETRRHGALRSFVGPRAEIAGLWERVRSWHRPPSLVRDAQPLYVLHPGDLRATDPVDVRRATLDDADLVIENSAEMIVGELGYDPRDQRAGYAASVRRAIALGAWWVWIVDGALRVQCNVGARTAATAQVQGVWTPPEHRGRGWARAGMASIARRLLAENATLSLYVNDFNAPAIRLYEALGFRSGGALATYLFP